MLRYKVRILILFCCSFPLIYCKESPSRTVDKSITAESGATSQKTTSNIIFVKHIWELNSDSSNVYWYGGGILGLHFEKGRATFLFNFKCNYSYPTKLVGDKIILIWDDKPDCDFDRGLKKSFGLRYRPIYGKPFGEFSLANDTTLIASYYYQEWIDSVNLNSKDVDTLFPKVLKIIQK
jgi:hypothetical protein